jgi:two-component system response regulator AtoC
MQNAPTTAKALLVEDDPSTLEALCEFLTRAGFEVSTAATLEEARGALFQREFDLLVTDMLLPDGNALALLREVEQTRQMLDVVFITGNASVDSAVEAFRGGVVDYLTKPVDPRRLRRILDGARRKAELYGQLKGLRGDLRELGRFGKIVGGSPAMQALYDQIQRVAPTQASVFISGPTGTGKELVAETVHTLSMRSAGPFVPVNCGAMSPGLIESELFGHERGSFTGAARRHRGLFERAHRGTLFLDEITEMPAELQTKLLRALESRMIQRVGGDELIPIDVRVIAATNRDPQQAVAGHQLREDLLYRLLVFPIQMAPLSQREGDIELLARHFLKELNRTASKPKRFTEGAIDVLRNHTWPGNVRELRNVVERSFIMSGECIDCRSIPLFPNEPPTAVSARSKPSGWLGIAVGSSIADAERLLLFATLEALDGDKRRAASQLGISLKTLYNRLNRYRRRNGSPASKSSGVPVPVPVPTTPTVLRREPPLEAPGTAASLSGSPS